MDAPADRRSHLDFLDGIRAAAALYVLAHHCWFELFPDAMNHRPAGATAAVASVLAFGHWAVAVFIVLSGFCLTLPVAAADGTLRGGPGRFYWRRVRRILPPYFVAVGFSLVLIRFLIGTPNGSHWDVSLPVDRRGLLGAVLLVGNVFGSYRVNHALWSVQVECQIYLLFPPLVWLARRAGMVPTTAAAAVVAFIAAHGLHRLRPAHGIVWDGLTVQFVGLFAVGMLAAHVAGRPRRLPAWAGPATMVVAVVASVALVWHWGLVGSFRRGRTLDAGVAGVVGPGLVLLARHPTSWPARLFGLRPLVWLGGLSYTFYLLHAPLVQVAYRYVVLPLRLPMPARLMLLIASALALTAAAAVPFYLLFERPFMSRRLRRTQPTARELGPNPASAGVRAVRASADNS